VKRRNDLGFLTHNQVGKWYDDKFTSMGGSWHVPAEELDHMLDLMGAIPVSGHDAYGKIVLELGSGDGKLMERILLRGYSVIGVDVSAVARRMTRDRLFPHWADNYWLVFNDPMERLRLAPDSVDFVISYGSMEHALSIPAAVFAMSKVLKGGGRFLNYAPNERWLHDDQPLETTAADFEWVAMFTSAGLLVDLVGEVNDNTIYVGHKP
jgi:SAM-dependent methyltransferase